MTQNSHQAGASTRVNCPMRHVSLRVPWHDTAWDGRVCAAPSLNGSCLRLKRIGEERDDAAEELVRGQSLQVLQPEQRPCCVGERVSFMAPYAFQHPKEHPYAWDKKGKHAHFKVTELRHPPYSAAAVPFAWLRNEEKNKDGLSRLIEEHGLDVDLEREPDLGFKTSWLQHWQNHQAVLDCFREHLKPEKSLAFFYAKHVPFVEDMAGRRVIIGVGRVLNVSKCQEYLYETADLDDKLRSMLWELMVQHSIRPDFKDGFLLPYHAAIQKAEADPDFDPVCITAFTPADHRMEFSYASELVTNDGAIAALLSVADALHETKNHLPGPWDRCLEWIDHRLGELWKARGPCPGLGAALSAFGLEQGHFVGRAIAELAGDNVDPWPIVDKAFAKPKSVLPAPLAEKMEKTIAAKWAKLPDERRALLKLVSRFELTREQATQIYVQEERGKAGIDATDKQILENPYLLYELTRLSEDPMSVGIVDRGVFPDEIVRDAHPLPAPSALGAGTDARRVRALAVSVLEEAASQGSTLLPQDDIVLRIRESSISPPCRVDGDLLAVAKDVFDDAIVEVAMADNAKALQLGRLAEMGRVIRDAIRKRAAGKRLVVKADWRKLLDDHLKAKGVKATDDLEDDARREKTDALKELAESRVSVLIGPAGTGKTTLLSVLCSHPDVADGGVMLLAPTGKARVRMEQATRELGIKGKTIAQFLSPTRYDGATGRYHLSDKAAESGAKTVIVDECSMLTEEMLAALLQALKGVDRLLLIGDPRQLPPIGAGRPFVDIIAQLVPADIGGRFPRVGNGYAELTIRRRQVGEVREDIQLAEWFSGASMTPGEDAVFDSVVAKGENPHVRFVRWDSAEDVRKAILDIAVEELHLKGTDDVAGFDASLGGEPWKETRFFNARRGDKPGAAEVAEGWQILSPIRTGHSGVPDLNRLIHGVFRKQMVETCSQRGWKRKLPEPKGPEKIVYGDKVINLANTDPKLPWNRHRKVYPPKDDAYIANGEIGVAVGFFWRNGLPDLRWKLEVEFSSQPGFKYDFTDKDFDEESSPILELAYALTVHKSQGSEFGTVMLVLPNPCRLLSREMLYTALTRQKNRVVILHQGDRSALRKYSSGDQSETARRLTNLFRAPSPVTIGGRFFEEGLIHRCIDGTMVRSKSEVIIYNALVSKGVQPVYEAPLKLGGLTRYPDFTIDDSESGNKFYWEHCGMLHVKSYRERWEEKLSWYEANGVLPLEKGGGDAGTLIVTRDEPDGSIDSVKISAVISRLA